MLNRFVKQWLEEDVLCFFSSWLAAVGLPVAPCAAAAAPRSDSPGAPASCMRSTSFSCPSSAAS